MSHVEHFENVARARLAATRARLDALGWAQDACGWPGSTTPSVPQQASQPQAHGTYASAPDPCAQRPGASATYVRIDNQIPNMPQVAVGSQHWVSFDGATVGEWVTSGFITVICPALI